MGHVKVYETPPVSAQAAIRKATEEYVTGFEYFIVPSDDGDVTFEIAELVADGLTCHSSSGHVRMVRWQGKNCLIAFDDYD